MATETETSDELYGVGSQPPTLLTEGQLYNKLHPNGPKYLILRKNEAKHPHILEAREMCAAQRPVYDKNYALWKSNNAVAAAALEKKQAEDKAKRQLADRIAKDKRKTDGISKTDDTESESEKDKPKAEEVKKKAEPAPAAATATPSKKGKKTVVSDVESDEEELDLTPKPKKAPTVVATPAAVAATPASEAAKPKKKAAAPAAEKTPASKGAPDMAKVIQEAKAKTTKPVISQADVKVPGESVNGAKPAAKSTDAKKRSKGADADSDDLKDGLIASLNKRFKVVRTEFAAIENLMKSVVEAVKAKAVDVDAMLKTVEDSEELVSTLGADMRGRITAMEAIVTGLGNGKSTK